MKDRDLPIVPTTLFLIALVLSVVVYVLRAPHISPEKVGQVVVDASGTVWAGYRNLLLEIDHEQPAYARSLTMQTHGIESHMGNVVALSDGSWLINRGGQEVKLLSDIKTFLRIEDAEGVSSQSSLLKCDERLLACTPWGDPVLQFDRVWSGVELSDGNLVINDVARHRIHLVSADGAVLDTMTGFRFPNQSAEHQQRLWVTDTNRHRITGVSFEGGRITESGDRIQLRELEGIARKHRWPSRIARHGDAWWLMIHEANMADGGIYRLLDGEDSTVRFLRDMRDPIDMVWQDGRLFLVDFASNAVWRFDPDTAVSERVTVPALELAVEQEQQAKNRSRRELWLWIAAIMVFGVGALIVALRNSKPVPLRKRRRRAGLIDFDTPVTETPHSDGGIMWIGKNRKVIRFLVYLPLLLVLPLCGVLAAAWFSISPHLDMSKLDDSNQVMIVLGGFGLVILAIVAIVVPRTSPLVRDRLGVKDGQLIYWRHPGKHIPVSVQSLLFTDGGFYTDETGYVTVQNQQHVFYDKNEFEKHALPLIQKGTRVGGASLYLLRLRRGDRTAMLELALTGLMLVVVIFFVIVVE